MLRTEVVRGTVSDFFAITPLVLRRVWEGSDL